MAGFNTLDKIEVAGKRVVVRADLNVPVKDGRVTDSTRIDRSAQTILELMRKGAKVIVVSHFGRPKGRDLQFSLRPVVAPLSRALEGKIVAFAEDCVGEPALKVTKNLRPGDVALLENLRFHPEEEKNGEAFAKSLASLGEVYVNDAFSCAHRAHASTEAIAKLLPSAAGRLMQAELEALAKALEKPVRPVAAIVGGAKISTKLDLLGNLVARVDALIIGGAMANTFLFAKGVDVGKSLCERDMAETARQILDKAQKAGCSILLPTDAVVASELKEGVFSHVVPVTAVPADQMILDFGPESAAAVLAKLSECRTLLWNGPLGAFETKPFDQATMQTAHRVADLTQTGALLSVAGGGDTVAALGKAGVEDKLSYVSTAGGAFLEWLEGKDLPGVAALKKSPAKPLVALARLPDPPKPKPAPAPKPAPVKAAPKKPEPKKAEPKKAPAKKAPAKKAPAKKPEPKKPAPKKAPVKKAPAKKTVAKKAAPKKAPVKKAALKKAPAKKPVAKKPVAKKPVAKKAAPKKVVAKKAPAKKAPAKKAPAKKPAAKKAAVKKTVAKKAPAKKPAAKAKKKK
jgi:phosphoglycerate kinase